MLWNMSSIYFAHHRHWQWRQWRWQQQHCHYYHRRRRHHWHCYIFLMCTMRASVRSALAHLGCGHIFNIKHSPFMLSVLIALLCVCKSARAHGRTHAQDVFVTNYNGDLFPWLFFYVSSILIHVFCGVRVFAGREFVGLLFASIYTRLLLWYSICCCFHMFRCAR